MAPRVFSSLPPPIDTRDKGHVLLPPLLCPSPAFCAERFSFARRLTQIPSSETIIPPAASESLLSFVSLPPSLPQARTFQDR